MTLIILSAPYRPESYQKPSSKIYYKIILRPDWFFPNSSDLHDLSTQLRTLSTSKLNIGYISLSKLLTAQSCFTSNTPKTDQVPRAQHRLNYTVPPDSRKMNRSHQSWNQKQLLSRHGTTLMICTVSSGTQNILKLNPAYAQTETPKLFASTLLSLKQLAAEDSFKPKKQFSSELFHQTSKLPIKQLSSGHIPASHPAGLLQLKRAMHEGYQESSVGKKSTATQLCISHHHPGIQARRISRTPHQKQRWTFQARRISRPITTRKGTHLTKESCSIYHSNITLNKYPKADIKAAESSSIRTANLNSTSTDLTRARHQRHAQICFLTDSRRSLTEAVGSPNLPKQLTIQLNTKPNLLSTYGQGSRLLNKAVLALTKLEWEESLTQKLKSERGKPSTEIREISWSSFCTDFRQEYVPESFVNDREREFDNLVQGSISKGEYARRFSSLLVYVPHVAGREKAKRNKYLEGLNEELYSFVLAGSPASYAEAVDWAIDIEEGLQNRRSRVRPQGVQGSRPVVLGVQPSQSVQSSQPPQQQVAQQPGHQRFRPHGRQFKKKSGSSSSGSGSSSSGSSKVEYCCQCGGKHPTAQCVGVQGSCNVCGQYGHFARVCPLSGSQHTTAPPQGRGGSFRDRSFAAPQQRLGEPQFRPFQQPGPSRFGQYSHPQFSGPQFAQVNAMTREQAEGTPGEGVIAGT
ncbi:hypothetical protein F511_17878 [Dorcoceras hygrometricum]|uniref:CCHC-type domain-containing protein n=1 Tax=Dorcoceras hygrometricum TaxID=472368 RepID=A0A2Z7CJP2_9LAMI|nr:hypothetical protein F511_17878 [Dorcoceras hygrometricum]